MKHHSVIIIGAGAAGLFCAAYASKRYTDVLVLEQQLKPGKKILMSGGGRCNFTNLHIHPDCYLSHNPHFCKSALSRYTQWDFIDLVKKHGIPFHEKTLGQLFCDHKSQAILDMLLAECQQSGVNLKLGVTISSIQRQDDRFHVHTTQGVFSCRSLVIATGGLSIPTMGSSAFAFEVAKQFNIKVWPTRAGLVPFTLHQKDKEKFSALSGVSVECIASNHIASFREHMLFTHRGLSGPAILQLSSYWTPGEHIFLQFLPDIDWLGLLKNEKHLSPKRQLASFIQDYLPKSVVSVWLTPQEAQTILGDASYHLLEVVAQRFQAYALTPNNTEGYRTAEVTIGGVDCDALSSKTMEARAVPGLYFIGEAVDVTGWLGGYNFQWAWSSAYAAAQAC